MLYLRRLQLEYKSVGLSVLLKIITSARVAVKEETWYDNCDGGTYGHDVVLFLPEEVMAKIPFKSQNEYSQQLVKDLNTCCEAIGNETFRTVIIELFDENDPLFQRAFSLADQPMANPDSLRIWTPGQIRLFVSHRDTKKSEAKQLAEALEPYGISAFVAHDTIEPMSTWQREIEKGPETMEVMLAYITDDFHESSWTNQEIGYALGKGIPIIPLRVESRDPAGFIGGTQALRGRRDQLDESVKKIYDMLCKRLDRNLAYSARLFLRSFSHQIGMKLELDLTVWQL
jgi:hypothetical protein